MSSFTVTSLLEKMNSVDKDFRFMATNDLMTELQRETVKLDEDTEKRMVRMLLQLLQDKNGEVQNLAVKCLGPLVVKVKNRQVETIVDTLCSNITIENEQLRDISSIGLKTVISELPPSSDELINLISKKMIQRLIEAISQKKDVTIQLEALDIISDLLNRFGGFLVQYHEAILQALLPQLNSQRLAVRKRSITAISCLLVSGNQSILDQTLTILHQTLSNLSNCSNMSEAKSHIQAIACIARQVGHRFGDHLSSIVPLVILFIDNGDDELKEYCIQAFESFVRRCPKEITPYIKSIIEVCLIYVQYDPNYNYEDEDEGDEMEMDNEDDAESNEEYSDDDDMSWKVRRASAKCLEAVISTRIDMMAEFYQTISPVLISRFKEREENVKVEIFTAYAALLKQTRSPIDSSLGDSMDQAGTAYALAQGQVRDIVKSLHKQLREKSIKTRQGAFMLLTDLITVMPSALHDDAATLIPGILFSLSDKNSTSNMKIDALTFLISFLKCNPPHVFQPHTQTLLPAIITAVSDSFYKISSEALLVMTQMIKVIRPVPGDVDSKFAFHPYIKPIYECTLIKLRANDIDQEVKERAITCMGQLISSCGDHMAEELKVTLPIFTDRLSNEITRLTCVKALINITSSPFKLDLSVLLKEAFPILASFLRKFQRALKLSTLTLLDTICKNYGKYLDHQSIEMILNEVPPLINESDLHVSQLTLSFLTSVTRTHSEMQDLVIVPQKIIPETLILVRSPLLQGAALQSVLDFFQALVTSSFPGLDHSGLVAQLTYPITSTSSPNTLHKQAFYSTARCIAAITVIDVHLSRKTVECYLNQLSSKTCSDAFINFAFLVIGEIGKIVDLAPIHSLKSILMSALSSESPFSLNATEDVKSAASFALGSIAVGNLEEYLPFVLQEIENRNRRQYLLLHSLKEIISYLSANPASAQLLEPHLNSIWSLLLNHCECPEEGTRNVVAECLGKLTLMNPKVLLDQLRVYLKHDSPLARATVVTAIKFTISDHAAPIDSLLKSRIGEFFDALKDDDINVRRVALVAFNSAAHNKPSLIRDLLPTILPHLYNETVVRKELIREVEMGPFKHTVDDGLDIRKAAFECMYTLLDSCLDRIDIFEFLSHVENGLKDHYDIKMLTYLMLIRLSTLCPSAVLNRMDRLIDPLMATCLSRAKANAVKQECEKQDELKRSALRAFMALIAIPDADKNSLVNDFRVKISSNIDLKILYEQIQKDTSTSPNHSDVGTPMDIC